MYNTGIVTIMHCKFYLVILNGLKSQEGLRYNLDFQIQDRFNESGLRKQMMGEAQKLFFFFLNSILLAFPFYSCVHNSEQNHNI